MAYSLYYQGKIKREKCWHFVGILRSFEHLAFDRTYSIEDSIFEFFVSPEHKTEFEYLMEYFKEIGLLSDLKQLPNRIEITGVV